MNNKVKFNSVWGTYKITFNSQNYNLPSGVYIYTSNVSGEITSKQMMLIK